MWIARKHDRFTGLSTGDFYELDGNNYEEAKNDLLHLLSVSGRYKFFALPETGPVYYRRHYYAIENTKLRRSEGAYTKAA